MGDAMAEKSFHRDSPVKILLVDDDETLCDSLSKILAKKGYLVTSRTSGPEAIKVLVNSSYDILITDLVLGEMNGVELVKEARAMAPRMAEIIITGHGDVDTFFDVMDLGVIEYLHKPVKCDVLESIIKKLTGHKA